MDMAYIKSVLYTMSVFMTKMCVLPHAVRVIIDVIIKALEKI